MFNKALKVLLCVGQAFYDPADVLILFIRFASAVSKIVGVVVHVLAQKVV
jgi:hypothetical protein